MNYLKKQYDECLTLYNKKNICKLCPEWGSLQMFFVSDEVYGSAFYKL